MTGGAATPERRRLVINADDFGYSAGVTRGIVEAHAAGSVTSTSMMANGIDWENAVRLARSTRTLDVGVHLNLVQGRPLLRVLSLTDARPAGRAPPCARRPHRCGRARGGAARADRARAQRGDRGDASRQSPPRARAPGDLSGGRARGGDCRDASPR